MMKKIIVVLFSIFSTALVFSQAKPNYFACENVIAFEESLTPDLGIIIYSDDVETVWNAMRLAVYSQTKGDTVVVFVLAKGVDAFMLEQDASAQYNVQEISDTFLRGGGFIYLCATCAKTRNTEEIQSCTITSIADLYSIVNKSKKVLTF